MGIGKDQRAEDRALAQQEKPGSAKGVSLQGGLPGARDTGRAFLQEARYVVRLVRLPTVCLGDKETTKETLVQVK